MIEEVQPALFNPLHALLGALLSLLCLAVAHFAPVASGPIRSSLFQQACSNPAAVTWRQAACEVEDVWGGCVRLELHECPAAESAAAVGRCLRSRHVVFLGDSVSRYAYLSLAQFLQHGTWASDFYPPSEHEGYFGSWSEYFEATTDRLGGRAVCDCYRHDYAQRWELRATGGNGSVSAVGSLENRYYSAPSGARLTFIQLFGGNPLVWHDPAAIGALSCGVRGGGCAQRLCAPAECDPRNTSGVFAGALDGTAFQAFVGQLLPTDIVINSGLWGSWEGDGEGGSPHTSKLDAVEQLAEAVACARDGALCGVPFSALHGAGTAPRLFWRTTTAPAPMSLRSYREPRLVAEVLRRGWRVIDAGGLGAALREAVETDGLEVWSDERGKGGWIFHNATPDACSGGGARAAGGAAGPCPPLLARLERERGASKLPFKSLWVDEVHHSPAVTTQLAKFIAAHLCAT